MEARHESAHVGLDTSRGRKVYCGDETAIYRAGCQQGKENPEQIGNNGREEDGPISARPVYSTPVVATRDLCATQAGSYAFYDAARHAPNSDQPKVDVNPKRLRLRKVANRLVRAAGESMRENGKDTEIVDLCLLTRPPSRPAGKTRRRHLREIIQCISHPKRLSVLVDWAKKNFDPRKKSKASPTC